MKPPNLYRIDDVLLKAAGLAVLAGLVIGPTVLGQTEPDAVRAWLPLLVGLGLVTATLLLAGIAMRRREQRVRAIWELLRQQPELHVPPLLQNSSFTREDLDRAVRFLNDRGLDHFVWDRASDTIRDASLQTKHLHVERCDACGVKIALDIPVAYTKLPTCTHCGDPISAEALLDRKREAIDALRAEHRFQDASVAVRRLDPSFSPLLFFMLFVFFSPAALLYLWSKWEGR